MIGSFSMVQKKTGRPLRFYEASLFQFINPKAWSIAVTVASGFFPTEENIFIGVAFVTITAAVICFPTISLWALFGSGLGKFVGDIKTKKIVEYILALLLVLTGIFILNLSSNPILHENLMFYLFALSRLENDWLIFYGSKRVWKTIKILRSIIIPIYKSKSLVNCSNCCIRFFSY